MVDLEKTTLACRSFDSMALSPSAAETLCAWAIGQAEKRNFSGLDLEKEISPPVEAEFFS